MREISTVGKWFFGLFLLLFVFMVSISFIFLLKPEYFIDDIKTFIEDRLPSSIVDEFNIGSIEGNFITGFKVNEVSYQKDSLVVFSAQEIYIDPDLSQIILGTIALSEVVIKNSYYNQDHFIVENQQFNVTKKSFFPLNYEITSLILENALIVFMDNMYVLNGELTFRYNDQYQIEISNIDVASSNFPSNLIFPGGLVKLYENEIIILDLIANSEWFSGSINGKYNLDDIDQISGKLIIDNFEYRAEGQPPINVYDFSAEVINNNASSIILKTNIEYQDNIISNIQMNGRLKDNIVMIDSAFMEIDGERMRFMGNFDIINYGWDVSIILDSFTLIEKSILSGIIRVHSPYLFEGLNGKIEFTDSIIDSLKISYISGNFIYNDGFFASDKISFSSEGYIGSIKVHYLESSQDFNISGKMELDEFVTAPLFNNVIFNSLKGNMEFQWQQNSNSSELSAHVMLDDGLLLKQGFSKLQADIGIKIDNGLYSVKSSGLLTGWNYDPYTWDSINFHIDHSDNDLSYYTLNATTVTGDSLKLHGEREKTGDFIITEFKGVLKQTEINITKPFYINNKNNNITFPQVNVKFGDSKLQLSGNYGSKDYYRLSVDIFNLDLNKFYSIIGKSYRINGLLKNAKFTIEKNDNQSLQFSKIFIENIDLLAGNIDEIQFDSLNVSAIYSNRSFLLNYFELDTYLGNINAKDGKINFGLTNNGVEFQEDDQLNLFFTFENVDISKFNRYLPWGLESRGLMTGDVEIKGSAIKPIILSNLNIYAPGFDKLSGENISGKIHFMDNKIYFRELSLITKTGRYSGFGNLPLNLNLIYLNKVNLFKTKQIEIAHEPIDFVFTGITNNIEYLPPYFSILDSLSSQYSSKDSLKSYSLELELSGTFASPIRNGIVIIKKGILFLDPIKEPIENINGTLSIINNQLIINEFTGTLNQLDNTSFMDFPLFSTFKQLFIKEETKNYDNLNIYGSIDLTDFFNPEFALNLIGDKISLSSSYDLFNGSVDANVSIIGKDTLFIAGQLIPTPYDFVITNLGDETSYKIHNIYTKRIMSYDLHVPIKEAIKVQTDNINLLFEGDINIAKIGDKGYNFSGKANIINGNFYDNQGNIFQNTNGRILLTPVDNIPYIDIHAQTMIDTSLIDVSIIGYTDNPTLFFDTSDYTQTEILQILTFSNTGNLNNPDQAGNLLSNYLENEVEKNITRYSTLDEFQLTSKGSLLKTFEGDNVDLKLILGKQISNRIYLNTQLNLNEFDKSRYEATYRLNQNTSLVGAMDENNLWHLSYRIKYYYK